MFRPQPNQRLQLGHHVYRFLPHPISPTFVYGQEGRMAVVYKLVRETFTRTNATTDERALKVFKAAYRTSQVLLKARELHPFAAIPGLEACARQVVDPHNSTYQNVARQYPELHYAVLMPWVNGVTWSDIMVRRRPLSRKQAWGLAWALVVLLSELETRGIAHCDLSGANLIVNWRAPLQATVALVDVEQLYAPGLTPPDRLLVGSPGYTPNFRRDWLWGPLGDRFAGAVLLAEILGWAYPKVVQHGNEQSYFLAEEVQKDVPRYRLLLEVLAQWRPTFADLLRQAWEAETPEECPSFQAWKDAFLNETPMSKSVITDPASELSIPTSGLKAHPQSVTASSLAMQPEPSIPASGDTWEAMSISSQDNPQSSELASDAATTMLGLETDMISTEDDVDLTSLATTQMENPQSSELASDAATTMLGLETDMISTEDDVDLTSLATTQMESQDTTQMVEWTDLEDPGASESPAITASAPTFAWQTHAQRARVAAKHGLLEQALQEYQKAMAAAERQAPEALSSLLNEYNELIFHQIHILQQRVAGFTPASSSSLSWSYQVGRWLAGLSTVQLGLLLGSVVFGAFVGMGVLASLSNDPVWGIFSPAAIWLALLLGLFPKSPLVVSLLFSSAVGFGVLGLSLSPKDASVQVGVPTLLGALGAAGAGGIGQLLDPSKNFWLYGIWSTAASVIIGLLVDDLAYGDFLKIFDGVAIVLNALFAFGAWYFGVHLQRILIAYREAMY